MATRLHVHVRARFGLWIKDQSIFMCSMIVSAHGSVSVFVEVLDASEILDFSQPCSGRTHANENV